MTGKRVQSFATRVCTRLSPVKAAALFLLPVPLVVAALAALFSDRPLSFAVPAIALACFWLAGTLAWRALAAECAYQLGDRPDLPGVPGKALSAAFTVGGAGLAAFEAGYSPLTIAIFAVLAALGHLAFFGRDLRPPRFEVTAVEGIDATDVAGQLEQATLRLRRIEAAARGLRVPEFRDRLGRVADIGHDIIGEMARDPRCVSRGRRFIHVYLESAERVTEQYARTPRDERNPPLDANFRKLLVDMETAFAEQRRRLRENDALALDVDIEVLSARLKRDGLAEAVEKRT